MKKTIIVPAGIGDASWVWSKLVHVRDAIETIHVVDGKPRRTTPYLELCGLRGSRYEQIDYMTLVMNQKLHGFTTWEDWRALEADIICLSANEHLENGERLESWLPDLPTEFHYPLFTKAQDNAKAVWHLHTALAEHPVKEGPIIGISCASYQGSEAWQTWDAEIWCEALRKIMKAGWRPIVVGGYWDDLTFRVASELGLPSLVGKTSIGECVEIMRLFDAYFGFSSGLNVIRTVLDRPAMALWPHHQNDLRDSWAPPKMLEEERYVSSLWRPLGDIWPILKRFLNRCESEAISNPHWSENKIPC